MSADHIREPTTRQAVAAPTNPSFVDSVPVHTEVEEEKMSEEAAGKSLMKEGDGKVGERAAVCVCVKHIYHQTESNIRSECS